MRGQLLLGVHLTLKRGSVSTHVSVACQCVSRRDDTGHNPDHPVAQSMTIEPRRAVTVVENRALLT